MRSSLHTLLFLSLSSTTLAATNLIPHKPPARLLAQLLPSSHFQDASVVIAAQCRPGELVCNDGCMPSIGECCSDGQGYCKQGYSCVTDGCCPIGKTCSDEISCDIGEVPCGEKKCMPKNAVCCSNGSYCQAGEECFQNGFKGYCQRADGSGNGSTTTGGSISIADASSSRPQSTPVSKTTHGEAPTSTSAETQTQTEAEASSTSSSISSQSTSFVPIFSGHPIVTPFLPKSSTTSATTTEFTSSSTTEASTATTTSGGNPTAIKMSGVMLAFVIVSIIIMTL
ncbi:uncharacterized protein TRIVIDRAFT_69322 [Trichoderma virens Gv29-8]|uniref:Carbohydrate-binding module family 18 protein n=1 Tax=Hypocrea virens (strain Gv29-8 / FGSC 10586) TaxID=413071 RepID=G9N2L7_HYPVG|nr:uncharacterized protein TRIVIDRAFT_69322 [Trichoderma virens Gv29-8]EHK19327.1 hypothetical protein TRIVIDRAFT_69322 [Trichoderma virens Gv29-8]